MRIPQIHVKSAIRTSNTASNATRFGSLAFPIPLPTVSGMERRFAPAATVHAERPETVVDRHWRAHARRPLQCALAFVGLLMLLDWGSGGLTAARAGLWARLGAVAFAVLLPARISAGDG
ncbi:hypothetical protein SAMN05216268_116187 [Streptomyces yunnanensis]|uniref:Uncharacterized protein n=2 Tax=Streptomyces yunnanensis TaxID=156453 RepID=A0A9X8N4K5_9ACTN|nr:hypothetical protein SAMN05216268_116187 [Streptomyces yunnanensis]